VKLAPGQIKACEACGVKMLGCLTRDGKVAPIEHDASEIGTVLIFRKAAPERGYEDPVAQCRTFGDGMALMELREQGVPMRLNHFASCPEAARFGK
jgi:hypothetical protein